MNIKNCFLPRKKNSHKGDFGHILIVAGSTTLSGAAVLCANACARSGAGLTTLSVPRCILPIVAAKTFPEVMILPLEDTKSGTICAGALKEIFDFIKRRKVSTVAIGPGLGLNSETSELVKKIISGFSGNLIIDADGLNSIKEKDLSDTPAEIIITPHPGEFSRLTKKPSPSRELMFLIKEDLGKKITPDIEKHTVEFAARNKVTLVLKKSGTIVTDGKNVFKNTTGNPGMASGGSGDVLTGMIAAFISQTKSNFDAAKAAVYIHGLAGDISAKEKTMVSMIPSDIIENIPAALIKIGIK